MVLDVYILLSPQEEEVHSSSWGHICTQIAAYLSKRFKPLSELHDYAKVIVELEKTYKEFSCVMFIMRLKSTFEIPISFQFQWMSLSNLFLIKFWKLMVLYLGCGCMTFDFMTQMISSDLLPMPMNKTFGCKDQQIYIPKCWERSQ